MFRFHKDARSGYHRVHGGTVTPIDQRNRGIKNEDIHNSSVIFPTGTKHVQKKMRRRLLRVLGNDRSLNHRSGRADCTSQPEASATMHSQPAAARRLSQTRFTAQRQPAEEASGALPGSGALDPAAPNAELPRLSAGCSRDCSHEAGTASPRHVTSNALRRDPPRGVQ
jgi:hypothetical protein